MIIFLTRPMPIARRTRPFIGLITIAKYPDCKPHAACVSC